VIDAVTFAHSFNAFWNDCTPMCEHFVRWLNVGGLERFQLPMARSESTRRSLIAELAFSLYVERLQAEEAKSDELMEAAWQSTERRLAPFVNRGLDISRNLNQEEMRDVQHIARSLMAFFTRDDEGARALILRPLFAGCGYVDSSEADVIHDGTLFEIKTVDRSFRGVDIRQLMTYCSLNFASSQYTLEKCGLFNPRTGLFYVSDIETVCREISGKSADELFSSVIRAISSGELSR
jgi:hypothetical protein